MDVFSLNIKKVVVSAGHQSGACLHLIKSNKAFFLSCNAKTSAISECCTEKYLKQSFVY